MDRYCHEMEHFLPVDVVHTRRYQLGLEAYLLLRRLSAFRDVVHFPNQHFGRYALWARFPFIITVHDLERMYFPFGNESPIERVGLKLDALGIRRARRIIAVSESTKADLIRYTGISQDRITVIPNGVNHRVFRPNGSKPAEFPYLLYVGSERPRKNLSRLLAAFAQLKRSGKFHNLKMVKIGSAGRSTTFREATVEAVKGLGLDGDVIFTQHLTDQQLSAYYSSAIALVYPSLYEGFGLPILEAMACGCPVITSNLSSLPEVAGDIALLVAPNNIEGLYKAMVRVVADTDLRRQLIARGLKHSHKFSWAQTAAATLEVYREVAASVGLPVSTKCDSGEEQLSPDASHESILQR